MTEVESPIKPNNNDESLTTNATTSNITDDAFAVGLKQIFEPIALECDARLSAVLSSQQSLLAQIRLLDTGIIILIMIKSDICNFFIPKKSIVFSFGRC